MTEEELDILASSYLDGEATSEEVALVERDPALMARVRELRRVQAALGAPTPVNRSLKEQHLAAALALFEGDDRRGSLSIVDQPDRSAGPDDGITIDLSGVGNVPPVPVGVGAGSEPGGDGVIDLEAKRTRRRPDNRLRWLSAAAGVLVFGFGAVFLANQMNSADTTDEVAVAAADESDADASAESASEDSAEDGSAGGAANLSAEADEATDESAADSAAPLASESLTADAEEALTADEDAVEETAEAADDAGDEPVAEIPPIVREDLPPSGFFPDEPVVTYSSVPSSDEIVGDLNLRWRDAEFARCATTAPLPDGAEVIGHLPIEVTTPGGDVVEVEALYLVIDRDVEVVLVEPDTCELF
jgi:hypothetical protein